MFSKLRQWFSKRHSDEDDESGSFKVRVGPRGGLSVDYKEVVNSPGFKKSLIDVRKFREKVERGEIY